MSIEKTVPLHWQQPSCPFALTLTAAPIAFFEHEKPPLTLTITPHDPQKKTEYTLTTVTLSHGVLEGAGSGVVLAPGATLSAGEQQFLFACPDEGITTETRVRIEVSVSNTQGDSRAVEQVLVVRPVAFSVNTWLRALSQAEHKEVIRGNQQGVAVEVRLEEVSEELLDKPFTLQDCQLPPGFRGQLINKAQEPLRFFPLSAQKANIFFLVFEPNATLRGQNPALAFQVKGPDRQLTAGRVDCALVQRKLFTAQIEHLLRQIKPNDRSALAENMAHLQQIDRLRGPIPEHISSELARIRPGLEEAYAVQEAIARYGSTKQAMHQLCYQHRLTNSEQLILRKLVESNPAMLLGTGQRPLRVAAYQMNLDAVRILVDIPQAIGQDVNTPTFPLLTGFISACYSDSRGNGEDKRKFDAIFDALIEVASIIDEKNSIGWTPLMEAVKAGDLNMVKKLVNKGVDVTAATTGEASYDLNNGCWVEQYRMLFGNKNTKGGSCSACGDGQRCMKRSPRILMERVRTF